jgi:hypothetical protein
MNPRMISLTTAVLLPGIALAQQQRPEWLRQYSPAQVAELKATIANLSKRERIRTDTLNAIAEAIGASNKNLQFDRLIDLVKEKAAEAAALKRQLVELKQQIANLEDPALRDPAERALARATKAFEEGRLLDAERMFGELAMLRKGESSADFEAWTSAMEAQVKMARLRLDYDRATELSLAAQQEVRAYRVRANEAADQKGFDFAMQAADAQFVKGRAYVDPAASERAAGLFRDALALDFVKNRPDRAATVQNELGKALSDSGQRRASEPLLLEAVAAFQAALEIYAPATDLQNWGTITGNIGTVYMRLGERTRDTARLLQARALFESVLAYKRAELGADVWLNAQTNLATTLQRIAERERNAAIFAQADAAFEIALNARKDGGPTATLAMIYLNRQFRSGRQDLHL